MINLFVSLIMADLILLASSYNSIENVLISGFMGINLMLLAVGVAIYKKNNEK